MRTLREAIKAVHPVDQEARARVQARLDRLTKPVGSLGRLEELAVRYVSITGKIPPPLPRAAVYTFAADHGVAREGVSAYPSAVTPQMVLNFLRGGAAVNVLARHVEAEVRVVDIGVAHEFGPVPGLIDRKIAFGTKNFAVEPAMSRAEAERALLAGIELAGQAAQEGIGLVGTGDMGIGNTTPSAAITAVLTGSSVDIVTGRGTGIDDEGYRRKVAVIERALALHRPDPHDPLDVLAKVGGFEIAGLAGLVIGAAAHRMPVVLDGFISAAAALVAASLQPLCREFMLASHLSVEQGHRASLRHLGLAPLLDLDLRLGEGTGACLGIDLIQASLKILTQMATFGEAGVSERSP
ncbi:MAG: nicotinate-nucleotide--dimethylbenzimidazole phosphoribosyltransferase [Nitrospirota bacterium]|nr:nicotinate-nucleotide--dimethylbenzimidazole phosphoribosyltransferase [Nitrospirota bacterium]MDE3225568.1 nicotinate-nucleotide--dimethylbenzimidazole phosphoribosyltransferase [Nitrospirota bacterium]MDE3241563.1 nicotinate-nucleotide--dimethylbenzimidazole phosphoribosyltransferase [Nitrospirota bacterium]